MLSVCFAGIPKEKNKMHRIGQVDDDHNDVHDTLKEIQQQLNERAAALKQTNAILLTFSATINEMRLDRVEKRAQRGQLNSSERAEMRVPRRRTSKEYMRRDSYHDSYSTRNSRRYKASFECEVFQGDEQEITSNPSYAPRNSSTENQFRKGDHCSYASHSVHTQRESFRSNSFVTSLSCNERKTEKEIKKDKENEKEQKEIESGKECETDKKIEKEIEETKEKDEEMVVRNVSTNQDMNFSCVATFQVPEIPKDNFQLQ